MQIEMPAFDRRAVVKTAAFDETGSYRYELTRVWDSSAGLAAFIGLNPSTADAKDDDATIRSCVRFARKWKLGGIVMLNLFAWRSTDWSALERVKEPIGALNDVTLSMWLSEERRNVRVVVAAWGVHGRITRRDEVVVKIATVHRTLMCLGETKKGHPCHPLYLPTSTELQLYRRRTT